MKKTLFILLFLATNIFANELPNIITTEETENKEKYVYLSPKDNEIIYNYLKTFKNKELEERLEQGLNPNSYFFMKEHSDSLLSYSISFNNIEATKLLLKYGADPNLIGNLYIKNTFPITFAIAKNDFEMVDLLIKNGALLNIQKSDEMICDKIFGTVSIVMRLVKTKEMLDFLVSKGADISQKMANGRTILDYITNNLELRKYIMDNYNLDQEYSICDYKGEFKVKHFYDKIQTFSLDNELLDERKIKNNGINK